MNLAQRSVAEGPARKDQGRVLVIGASRGTGAEIVAKLVRDGFPVRALVRDIARAREQFSAAVEIAHGDVTRPDTLRAAMHDVVHVIFTAGVTKRPASEQSIVAVEYEGVQHAVAAAVAAGAAGRFLYMTALGVTRHSLSSIALNLIKGRTLVWRRRAEDEIRRSGLDYTIIRCGVLKNAPAGTRQVRISQTDLRMALWRQIGRADAAEVFVQALQRPNARRTTFDAVWTHDSGRTDWEAAFSVLRPDSARVETLLAGSQKQNPD